MNKKLNEKIDSILDVLGAVVDGLEALRAGIEAEDDEQIGNGLDMFPTPKVLERALQKLGGIITATDTYMEKQKEKKNAG